jgi:hypothetical protein
MKGVVLCACAAALVAAFAAGRVTAPVESAQAPDDLGAAIRAALAEKDGVDRAERTARVLQQLDAENVDEVAAVYDRMLNILDEHDIRPFAIAWARFDPAAALDHALGWPFRDKQQFGAYAAIEAWAARLPSFSQDLFLSVVAGWTYSDEGGLEDYLTGVSNQRLDMAITRVVARLIRNGGPNSVFAWAEEIIRNDAYEKRFKKRAFRRTIGMVGRWDPERAAAWSLEHLEQEYAVDAPRIISGQLGALDGKIAMKWVREHTSDDQRKIAVREAFRTWLLSDREGAVEWLESETLIAFHDPAISFYAKFLSDRTPEEAIPWCERILDEERRLACFKKAASKWYSRDAIAAETWLQQSPLDEAARSAARAPIRKKDNQPKRGGPDAATPQT